MGVSWARTRFALMAESGYCWPPAVTMMVPLLKLTAVTVAKEVVVASPPCRWRPVAATVTV